MVPDPLTGCTVGVQGGEQAETDEADRPSEDVDPTVFLEDLYNCTRDKCEGRDDKRGGEVVEGGAEG